MKLNLTCRSKEFQKIMGLKPHIVGGKVCCIIKLNCVILICCDL